MGNICGSQANAVEEPAAAKPVPPAGAEEAKPAVTETAGAPTADAATEKAMEDKGSDAVQTPAAAKKLRVYIVYYSTYGHIARMAEEFKSALQTVDGVDVKLFQVAETLPAEVLEKMHAPPKSDVPILSPLELPDADAFVFGFPTRFGMMAAQMKNFFDATGMLWQKGALQGKPASLFTSTASQGGGQETTIMTAVTQLAHHGMIYVPAGFCAGGVMFGLGEAKGGSPWGAGALAAGDGSRQPSEAELEAVRAQAKYFGEVAKKLAA
ncbi:hypothetical protein Agub_g11442 [Astrephomene gubernaculifera]|uniref:NAD(P)H dehydrogenase (quinone) n=1 Tax=Astrephomene gubernaculifera TaxID=47775 RepID=A0AAD3DWH4_9CHLO|nr:hypothetical protein Agub_g11442 [Astrephomene gubernaculifera]